MRTDISEDINQVMGNVFGKPKKRKLVQVEYEVKRLHYTSPGETIHGDLVGIHKLCVTLSREDEMGGIFTIMMTYEEFLLRQKRQEGKINKKGFKEPHKSALFDKVAESLEYTRHMDPFL